MECTVLRCLMFILISAEYVTGTPQDDFYTESEVQDMNRQDCWKNGGVINNHWYGPSTENYGLAIKTAPVNGIVTAYNYGVQFTYSSDSQEVSEDNGMKIEAQTKSIYLQYSGVRLIWGKLAQNGRCQRVFDYKCLQDITINTAASLEKFNKMNCSEVKKDLVIDGLALNDPKNSFEALQKIQKVHGRLVIRNFYTERPLVFTNLINVGGSSENEDLPSIQIHGNVMQDIQFPKISMNKCATNLSRNCVSIENNWNFYDTDEPLDIKFKMNRTAIHKTTPNRIVGAEPGSEAWLKEKERLEKDPTIIKRENIKHTLRNWIKEGFGEDSSIILGVLSFLILAGLVGYIVWFFTFHWKKYETYDFRIMEKEDENETPKNDDDYFKVDGNKDKDRDSGMDDLGSN